MSLGNGSSLPKWFAIRDPRGWSFLNMIIEEYVPTSIGQAHGGALPDLRIMRKPENFTEAKTIFLNLVRKPCGTTLAYMEEKNLNAK